MTTTACDDQFAPEPVEPVRERHERYDTATILRRNIASLEVALRTQTERAEKAETELAKMAQQKPVGWMREDGNLYLAWQKDLCLPEVRFSPLYAAPVPAPHKGATHCDDCGLTWLDDGLNPLRCPYCKDAIPAPAVPDEWKRAVSEFLSSYDAAWAELFKSMPTNVRSVSVSEHQADAVRAANVLRALLQSSQAAPAVPNLVGSHRIEAPDCRACANRGRANWPSQESFCDGCIYQGRDWRKNHFVDAAADRLPEGGG